jgi:predicted acyl esterase
MHTAQFKKNYILILQSERGSEWSEGDFGILTTTTADAASDKSASTLWGDGALVPTACDAGTDGLIADPHNPVQSLGGDLATHDPICVDQRVIECRADVLVYSTPVLTEPKRSSAT